MNCHENAPATKMLATNCCVCNRPLVDAVSVELGIGPICRERHGYNQLCDDDVRIQANKLVYEIALERDDEGFREAACAELRLLGFIKLARRIEYRGKDEGRKKKQRRQSSNVVKVEVYTLPSRFWKGRRFPAREGFLVTAPYIPAAVEAWKEIHGRVWVGEVKANFVPTTAKQALWGLLKQHYSGLKGLGPRGEFAL